MINNRKKPERETKPIIYKCGHEIGRNFTAELSAVDSAAYKDKSAVQRLRKESGSYIIAVCDSRIVGYVCYNRAENGVFIDSIAVHSEFQRQGVGKTLICRLFALLVKEIQNGGKIQNVYSYAYTEEGAALLRSFNFTESNGKRDGAPLMRYEIDDFSETNMYLFVPFFVNGELDLSEAVKPAEEGDNSYLAQLGRISEREFGNLSEVLKRGFIAKEKFIVTDGEGKKLCGDKECKIYLTAYKNFYVATIVLRGLGFEPSAVIHQAAGGALYINTDGRALPFNAYLAERFGLKFSCARMCVNMTGKAQCFRQAYGVKCFTSLTAKPETPHLAHMLACDCYGAGGMDETLTSRVFYEKARHNLEEHQFTQIYASEKSVVYVLADPQKDRLLHESRMIFVIELLSLQICAFSSNYEEVVNGLDKREFSRRTIENVNFRYSRAAKLWDINNFRYLPAKNVFGALTAEFGIYKLKEELKENLNTFEKMTTMDLQKRVERHSKTSKILLALFSLLTGISALSAVIGLFFGAFNEKSDEAAITLAVCGFALALLGALGVFLMTFRRKRAELEKDAKCSPANCRRKSCTRNL